MRWLIGMSTSPPTPPLKRTPSCTEASAVASNERRISGTKSSSHEPPVTASSAFSTRNQARGPSTFTAAPTASLAAWTSIAPCDVDGWVIHCRTSSAWNETSPVSSRPSREARTPNVAPLVSVKWKPPPIGSSMCAAPWPCTNNRLGASARCGMGTSVMPNGAEGWAAGCGRMPAS